MCIRRGGLHVESPGLLSHSEYVPGSEHFWGRGIMMRPECFDGGIYMCSNEDNSCAVWNSLIHDPNGDIIGAHGNIERLRPLLGPADIYLQAGELVWITDKTPHESIKLRENANRQYFRLVLGEVTAWFEDHSTANPLFRVPDNVRVVSGNKFLLYPTILNKWFYGTNSDLHIAAEELKLRTLMFRYGVGHLAQQLINFGIQTISELNKFVEDRSFELDYSYRLTSIFTDANSKSGQNLFIYKGYSYYDAEQFLLLLKSVSNYSRQFGSAQLDLIDDYTLMSM